MWNILIAESDQFTTFLFVQVQLGQKVPCIPGLTRSGLEPMTSKSRTIHFLSLRCSPQSLSHQEPIFFSLAGDNLN